MTTSTSTPPSPRKRARGGSDSPAKRHTYSFADRTRTQRLPGSRGGAQPLHTLAPRRNSCFPLNTTSAVDLAPSSGKTSSQSQPRRLLALPRSSASLSYDTSCESLIPLSYCSASDDDEGSLVGGESAADSAESLVQLVVDDSSDSDDGYADDDEVQVERLCIVVHEEGDEGEIESEPGEISSSSDSTLASSTSTAASQGSGDRTLDSLAEDEKTKHKKQALAMGFKIVRFADDELET